MTLYDNTDLEDAHCMCSKKVKVSYSAKSFDIYDKEEDARQNKCAAFLFQRQPIRICNSARKRVKQKPQFAYVM